jgi:hypothetical protein
LQQSPSAVQEAPSAAHAHVPAVQTPLQQSVPAPHASPRSSQHEPPRHCDEQQSVVAEHDERARLQQVPRQSRSGQQLPGAEEQLPFIGMQHWPLVPHVAEP